MNLSVAAYSDPGTDAHLVSFLFVGDVALNESSPERLCDALCGAVQCDAETCERHARFERIDLGVDARGAPQTRVRAETVVLCVREPRCFYAVNALRGAGSDLQLLDRAFREEGFAGADNRLASVSDSARFDRACALVLIVTVCVVLGVACTAFARKCCETTRYERLTPI